MQLFFEGAALAFADTKPFIMETMANFNYSFLECIILARIVDFGTVAYKFYKVAK